MMSGSLYMEQVRRAFLAETTYGTTLAGILFDLFGTSEWLGWEPETVSHEFAGAVGLAWSKVPQVNRDKIAIMGGIYSSNLFFQSLEAFIATANVLSGTPLDVRVFDPATVSESAWAVTEVKLNGFEEEFHPEIGAYIGVQAGLEGFESLPKVLSWAEKPKRSGGGSEAAAAASPELFAASYSQNQDDVREVENEVAENVQALKQELDRFPFRRRDTEGQGG